MDQWARLCSSMQRAWVRSVVGELRSHISGGQKMKTKQKKSPYTESYHISRGKKGNQLLSKLKTGNTIIRHLSLKSISLVVKMFT